MQGHISYFREVKRSSKRSCVGKLDDHEYPTSVGSVVGGHKDFYPSFTRFPFSEIDDVWFHVVVFFQTSNRRLSYLSL